MRLFRILMVAVATLLTAGEVESRAAFSVKAIKDLKVLEDAKVLKRVKMLERVDAFDRAKVSESVEALKRAKVLERVKASEGAMVSAGAKVSERATVPDDYIVTVDNMKFTIPEHYLKNKEIEPATVKKLIGDKTTLDDYTRDLGIDTANFRIEKTQKNLRKIQEYGYILLKIKRGNFENGVKDLATELRAHKQQKLLRTFAFKNTDTLIT
ncbi:RxLR-like protein [Plasmopara halstedii]|uniref:RxLR-like protein n=1 Tax=Plasmopara halstedii TaxID=4781 RepID=A0A0P1AE39_PLAHL|nr:RxLR-like protein [Plasmopara halstedii]CEG38602.1 RxLR-like protein [Plasmopara halstedii]|eukprot:XP_024574971.1 RxLR-like protein [Plasmopara halstedii]